MDASAYLRKQGWRGDGHSLDHTNRGIRKPLLVSKKVDVLGVGLNKHAAVSDQWWLRAFDQGLKSLGTGEESVLGNVQKHGVNRGGLYGRFVKGEGNPGSFGERLLPTPEDSESAATNTPIEPHVNVRDTMAVDVPPEDKLERVVGHHENQNGHDAMMHLLQNPDEAPASMRKMLDKKRKRAERPVEKRARRRDERHERARDEQAERREKEQEDGIFDYEKEEERRRMKEINRRANDFVLEAQRQGIIPAGPNELRKGLVPTGANAVGQPSDEMKQVFDQAGLNTQVKFKGSGKNSLKAQKYAREKAKRELKRAAKAYLMGEKPPQEMTIEEKKAKKAAKREGRAAKLAAAAAAQVEKMQKREERAAKKRAHRAKKKEERAEVEKIIAEREAAQKAGKTIEEYYAERAEREAAVANGETNGNEFDNGADHVLFKMNSKGNTKKIPGVGAVDRYPTKAEKKAKKLQAMAIKAGITDEELKASTEAEQAKALAVERVKIDAYRAMKKGMSLEEYRDALAEGEVHAPKVERKNIDPAKLAEYQKRADQKGMKLEEYIRRREEKTALKKSEELGNPFQQDIIEAAKGGADYIGASKAPKEQRSVSISMGGPAVGVNAAPPDEEAVGGFIVDTAGDDNLAKRQTKFRTDFSNQAIAAMSEGKPLAIIDTEGDENFTWEPNMPVPLDPRVWEGQKVKDLPKHVRKARKEWMRAKREERKSAAIQGSKKPLQKKSKGQRKVEAREAFVKQILYESRRALRNPTDSGGSGMVTIEGIENIPLVKLETTTGIFKKGEVSLARTVARRVLRNVKRAQKAERGKGKGWKKRERSAKEAARNAGISGPTDRPRMDPEMSNRDLLL